MATAGGGTTGATGAAIGADATGAGTDAAVIGREASGAAGDVTDATEMTGAGLVLMGEATASW